MDNRAISLIQRPSMRAAYTPLFRSLLKQHPDALRQFMKVHARGLKSWESGGFQIEALSRPGMAHCGLWKLTLDGQAYFVKETAPTSRLYDHGGVGEMLALSKLVPLENEHVRAVEYLAAVDLSSCNLILTRYYPHERMLDSKKEVPTKLKFHVFKFAIRALLNGVYEINMGNVFHDKAEGKALVFDVVEMQPDGRMRKFINGVNLALSFVDKLRKKREPAV
ncbi:Uncharacterised protein [uncultured archaeon]|nr:Uncharacterised protein [uncultured archaeon]